VEALIEYFQGEKRLKRSIFYVFRCIRPFAEASVNTATVSRKGFYKFESGEIAKWISEFRPFSNTSVAKGPEHRNLLEEAC
jgi:hypothetical protein